MENPNLIIFTLLSIVCSPEVGWTLPFPFSQFIAVVIPLLVMWSHLSHWNIFLTSSLAASVIWFNLVIGGEFISYLCSSCYASTCTLIPFPLFIIIQDGMQLQTLAEVLHLGKGPWWKELKWQFLENQTFYLSCISQWNWTVVGIQTPEYLLIRDFPMIPYYLSTQKKQDILLGNFCWNDLDTLGLKAEPFLTWQIYFQPDCSFIALIG